MIRVPLTLAIAGSLIIFAALAASAFAQTPPPVNFVSGQLFSGVGHGDRIPGAANVYTLAVGDFNNDGKLDLVTANNSNGWGLGLVIGNGDGTFQPPIEIVGYDTYGAFGGITAGDFNKDGNLDFAVLWLVGYGPVQLGVYMNDGHGDFTLNNSYSIGTTVVHVARSLATADVSGDGNLDLIVPDLSNLTVAVLYGKGDGAFPTSAEFATANQTTPTGAAVGDFNKDGKPDIVVASSTGCCPLTGGISVLLNSGGGAMQAPFLYPNPNGVDSGQVAVADLNADGKLDVVESSMGGQGVAVFLGNGDGTFQTPKYYLVPWASSVAIGNLTSDKKPDLVVSSYYDGTVWSLFNKGKGIFQVSGVYSTDWSALSIALADFNGDKNLDFVTGNSSGQFVTIALGNGDATFRDSAHYNESGSAGWTNGFAVADFNRDGSPDVVQAGGGTGVGLSLMLGTSHGVPKTPSFINIGGSPYSQVYFVLAGDVSGDGKPDIVSSTAAGYGNPYGVVVLLGLGTGKFKPAVLYSTSPSSYPATGALADLNGDKKLDIVTSNFDGSVSVLLNKAKGVYGAPTVIPSVSGTYPTNFVVGDFTSDNKADVILNDYPASHLVLLRGNGDGTFQLPNVVASPVRPLAPVTADFNRDGKLDLAVPSGDNFGSIAILLGNGNGTFNTAATYNLFNVVECIYGCDHYPNSVVAVDLNGDGKLDLAIAPGNPQYNTCGAYRCAEQYLGAVLFLGNGDGTFVRQSGWLAGAYPAFAAAGDFNSDGMPDLAFLSNNLNYGQTSVTILQNATQPVSVSPLSIKYPAKPVGASNMQTVLLTNDQTTSLVINSIAVGGANPADFSSKSACGSHLATGAYCTISVTFHPAAIGTRTAELIITDDLGVQSVQLSGVGK